MLPQYLISTVGTSLFFLRVLLEEEEATGRSKLLVLAPIGQIYLDGFRQRYPAAKTLPPPASERTEPSFRDDHYPDGFKAFVRKVWQAHPFIKSCHSIDYERQRSIRLHCFSQSVR